MEFFSIKNKKKDGGQVIIIAALFSVLISLAIVSAISSPVVGQLKTTRDLSDSKKSFFNSESGLENISYKIKNAMNISSLETLSLNGGESTIVINDINLDTKELISVGDVNNKIRKNKSIAKTTSGVSFHYGLFTGQGGLNIGNNSVVNGSIYSNGSIVGSGNVRINGDVYVATRPATTTNAEWITYNDDFIFGKYYGGQQRVDVVQGFKITSVPAYLSKMAFYVKKVGLPANLNVLVVKDKNGSPDSRNIIASGVVSSSLISTEYSFIEVGFDVNPELVENTQYWVVIDMTRDDDNYYVLGFDNEEGYTDGIGKYSNDWERSTLTNINGDINFKLWVSDAENDGVLSDVIVADEFGGGGFSAHAHNIINSDISGDAYAQSIDGGTVDGDVYADNISNCTVGGNANYNVLYNCLVGGEEITPTIPPSDLPYLVAPVSEGNIEAWKAYAILGGTLSSGDLIPEDGDSIGPGIVEGDLIIGSGKEIFVDGNVYVKGNVQINGGASVSLGIFYGTEGSGAIIADGWVDLYNNVILNSPRSGTGHLMILTTARCDQHYGFLTCNSDNAALSINNNVDADILTAPYGAIKLNNNISASSLVGNTLWLDNNIILNYEQGLTNINFSSGPGGSWEVESWRETE